MRDQIPELLIELLYYHETESSEFNLKNSRAEEGTVDSDSGGFPFPGGCVYAGKVCITPLKMGGYWMMEYGLKNRVRVDWLL